MQYHYPHPLQIPSVFRGELARPEIAGTIQPGMHIAITSGSRGVANVDIIPRTIVEVCKEQDAHPFIIPAMGRHGGANVEGQKELLSGYGITDKAMGCPVWTTMETVLLGYSEYGRPVYQNKYAHEADGIIISCRIKPHNAVRGPYKSGVCKKMVVAERSNLLSAIPSIENAYDETAIIEAIPTQPIFAREPELLKIAAANMPSILVREADVLIVDAMEKNYSGQVWTPTSPGPGPRNLAAAG